MERPTVISCQCLLGDGTTCGVDVPVGERGNIPKYCETHRDQHLRNKLAKEWERNQAAGVNDAPDGGGALEQESGDAEEAPTAVCRARSCSIPLTDEWVNEFCPAHWRILGDIERSELVGSRPDEALHDVAILRALRFIGRYETGVDPVTGRP